MKKAEAKRLMQEEINKQKQKYAEEQNEMLENARREMLEQGINLFPCVNCDNIEILANQQAMSYLSNQSNDMKNSINFEDLVLLYKVLLTPANLLIEKMYFSRI